MYKSICLVSSSEVNLLIYSYLTIRHCYYILGSLWFIPYPSLASCVHPYGTCIYVCIPCSSKFDYHTALAFCVFITDQFLWTWPSLGYTSCSWLLLLASHIKACLCLPLLLLCSTFSCLLLWNRMCIPLCVEMYKDLLRKVCSHWECSQLSLNNFCCVHHVITNYIST